MMFILNIQVITLSNIIGKQNLSFSFSIILAL